MAVFSPTLRQKFDSDSGVFSRIMSSVSLTRTALAFRSSRFSLK